MMKNAMISVSDRTGVAELGRGLVRRNIKLFATGGTANFLKSKKIPVTDIKRLTGFGSLLGGRVKSLHPAVFAGLLARPQDDATLNRHGFPRFDLLVSNFYKLPRTPRRGWEDQVDVGGVALVRAAAKNSARCLPVVDPADYLELLSQIDAGVSPVFRAHLAARAWRSVAAYDLAVLRLADPTRAAVPGGGLHRQALALRYGENPHQRAEFWLPDGVSSPFNIHQGKELSFCNLLDIHAASRLLADAPKRPFCAIIKHNNACGAAVAATAAEAFTRALAGDPQSAFGGVIGFNRLVTAAAARRIVGGFFEVVVAPAFDPAAREIFSKKKNLRLLSLRPVRARQNFRSALGGTLVQDDDSATAPFARWRRVAGSAPSRAARADLELAWILAKHIKSNAIALVRGGRAIGIGAGQQSRVDAVKIAIDKARRYRHARDRVVRDRVARRGAVCASDGFFPFADSIGLLARAGVRAVAEPGGSVRDTEVIAAAKKYKITLYFTGRRHFNH